MSREGFAHMNTQHTTRAAVLTRALALAITAPTDAHAEQAAAIAEAVAQAMSPQEVEACKAAALAILSPEPQP